MTRSKQLAPTPNRKRTTWGYIAFAVLLACLLSVPTPSQAAPGDITTVAGDGLGQGPALFIGQVPANVVVSGPFIYVADSGNNVVRRLDTRTGNEIVVAGKGGSGFGGDGGPATDARFNGPSGLAVDTTGNLFIADTGNQRIRVVDTAGTITSVAGNGTAGFGGDGGPATSAQLNRPVRVAVDHGGNLFIADTGNNRIRMVDTAGTITTVAGGLGQGPALAIGQTPTGVVVSGPFVYVADSGSYAVRRIDTRTGSEIVVAGNGTAGFSGDGGPATSAQFGKATVGFPFGGPSGLAVDPAGNLFIADQYNQRIRKVDAAGIITTVAGGGAPADGLGDGGPATSAQLFFYGNAGVAVNAAGTLFIAGNGRIRKVDAAGIITTVAGGGSPADGLGDGGPATSAQFCGQSGVAVDQIGNLFIADSENNRIRKVDAAGTITTVAGSGPACRPGPGSCGLGGDGGPATSAKLCEPSGVAVDPGGNLFIVDNANNRIRKVDTAGTITTVAGSGPGGLGGGFSGDGGPASMAELNLYQTYGNVGVAVDPAGNLFIADTGNNRLRKVDTAGTITTIAGGGGNMGSASFSGDGGPATSAQLNSPSDVAVDPGGNLFIADTGNNRIRAVDTAGTITSVAGSGGFGGFGGDGGPATSAQLNAPSGVAVDTTGNLFIADNRNNRIRKVDTAGTMMSVAGNGTSGFGGDGGPATSGQLDLYGNAGVAVDAAGNLYIADTGNERVRKVDTVGTITTVAGNGSCCGFSGDGGAATSAQLNYPRSVTLNAAGNLFIADTSNNRIRTVDAAGIITTVAGGGSPTDGLGDGGPAASAQLNAPWSVTADTAGNLFIADTGHQRIRKIDTAGTITTVAGDGTVYCSPFGGCGGGFSGDGGPATSAQLSNPFGVAVDGAGNLFIADSYNQRIRKVDTAGTITSVAGTGECCDFSGDGGPATSAQLSLPSGVAVDTAGDLFIADTWNQRIRKVDPAGTITTVAGGGTDDVGDGGPATSAQLSNTAGVAVDTAGNLLIADQSNQRIRKVDPAGTITTVAGNGTAGFSGDGGPATSAELSNPAGVAVDEAGNLFIADTGNTRIRMVQPPPPPTVTNTPTPTVTGTPPTATPSPSPHCGGAPACVGDCKGDGAVDVSELIAMVNIALGDMPIPDCMAGDANGDCLITIDEIIKAVGYALSSCPGG
jgi:sugar lactone lactonase YvrE